MITDPLNYIPLKARTNSLSNLPPLTQEECGEEIKTQIQPIQRNKAERLKTNNKD